MPLSFFVTVYKDDNAFYGTSGASLSISCNHQVLGDYYLNTVGEEFPIPTTTVPLSEPGTDWEHGKNMASEAGVYASPNVFNKDFIRVTRVKDLTSNVVSYVDPTSFDTNVVSCNPVENPSVCSIVTSLSAGTPGTTTATITFTAPAGPIAGYEYIVKTTNVTPVIEGTFATGSPIALSGLTAATTYYFFIKTICGGGSTGRSAWTSFSFVTHA